MLLPVSRTRAFFDALELDSGVDDATDLLLGEICTRLRYLCEVGLGYVRLGQPATTLSGGEAQRVKLSKELSKRDTGRTLYILDEPTTGLHFHDIKKLLTSFNALIEQGLSLLVIEHNTDVIKSAELETVESVDAVLGRNGAEHRRGLTIVSARAGLAWGGFMARVRR